MNLARELACFNRLVTNRAARLIAGRAPGYAIVIHRGRKSNREYHTPVNIFEVADGFRFPLLYGQESDWVRNVLAAGEFVIEVGGRRVPLTAPSVGEDATAAWLPPGVRHVARLVGAAHFLAARVAMASGMP